MPTRLMLLAVLVACHSGAAPDAKEKCTVPGLEKVQAVSCSGEVCLVCTEQRCRLFRLAECR
jgi:hypothetical protein